MEYRMDAGIRSELLDRRERLTSVAVARGANAEVRRLLDEVDAALARHDHGTYGLCETCGDPIEDEALRSDPLVCFCIDHLSRSDRDALERDLALAGRVQRALLPRQDVAVGGWQIHWRFEPAGPVSGDYCDLILPRRDDDGVLFVVGDVSGKGVAASLLSAHLNALFRTLAGTGIGIDDMMRNANRHLCESTLENHYATLVAGRVRPDGTVEFANAGQPAPAVVGRDRVEAVEGAGLPLGMFCSIDFVVHRRTLAPGDSLVVYTDGVIEARNPVGEDLGSGRLADALRAAAGLPAPDVAARCLDAVRGFRGTAPPNDDLTLLVLRRTGSPAA